MSKVVFNSQLLVPDAKAKTKLFYTSEIDFNQRLVYNCLLRQKAFRLHTNAPSHKLADTVL